MNWHERAEKAMDAAQRFVNGHFGKKDKPMPIIRIPAQPDSDSDLVLMDYIRESAERIAMLEKALAQAMETNLQLQVIEAPCILNGVSPNHIGKECIVFGGYYPGEVLGLATEYPELAQWLREQDDGKMEEQK